MPKGFVGKLAIMFPAYHSDRKTPKSVIFPLHFFCLSRPLQRKEKMQRIKNLIASTNLKKGILRDKFSADSKIIQR